MLRVHYFEQAVEQAPLALGRFSLAGQPVEIRGDSQQPPTVEEIMLQPLQPSGKKKLE